VSWERILEGESRENKDRFTELAAKIGEAVVEAGSSADLQKVLKMTGGNIRTTLLNNLKILEVEMRQDFAGK